MTLKDIFCPTQNETASYERNLKEHTGKAPIRIVEKSPLLHALGLPDGSISISERALNKAREDKSVSTLIDKLPEIVSDPSSIIDTGLKARKDSKSNCLLFAYNTYQYAQRFASAPEEIHRFFKIYIISIYFISVDYYQSKACISVSNLIYL